MHKPEEFGQLEKELERYSVIEFRKSKYPISRVDSEIKRIDAIIERVMEIDRSLKSERKNYLRTYGAEVVNELERIMIRLIKIVGTVRANLYLIKSEKQNQ